MPPPVVEPPPLDSEVSLADHPCLKRPKITVVEPGRYKEEYRKVAEPDETFDMRGTFFEGNPPKFPIWITPNPGACLVGPTVQGQQSRSLTWRDLKKSEGHILDGDAIGWDGRESKGPYEIVGAWLDNMEDAFGPPKSPGDTEGRRFKISHVYARYIRDDFIENDACSDMELHDSLIDGTFAFISARPGVDNTAQPTRPGHTIIRNTVVRMQCMPGTQDNGNGTCPAGNSVGQIFKWGRCSGDVDIKDTIIRVDANVVTLTIPPGKYENVTLIWLGPGDNFPVRNGPLPPGIRVTKDVSIWEKARAEWLKRHGCDPKGDSCSFLKKSPE